MASCVEIISIGNELLIGKTLNTNATWLAKEITSIGLSISRITVIGDDVKEIVTAVQDAVLRKPSCVITTGGLGPTFDDKTFEAIADATNSVPRVNEKALEMIEEKYAQYAKEMNQDKFELTPARIKMATIPEGAKPLPNPVGTAPAISIQNNGITIFALPGVPSEMKAIFEQSLAPFLRAVAGHLKFFAKSIDVSGIMESEIAPIIDQVMHDNPRIYIKSHPMGAEKKPRIELHLSTIAEELETAKKRVSKALRQLSKIIKAKDGRLQLKQ
ncbi:MAG: nicotinamide mononucleotide deamidase-related protein [Candidatus Bathyarchaeota archaeon]|nr:MAG: nicotinamide mononucleotide deamidase-related protein [Candidatus Bathyarchaeota archaeon]